MQTFGKGIDASVGGTKGTAMMPQRFALPHPTPLDQLRACANLMMLLGDWLVEEAVLRRNGVRITPQLCLEILAELELVAGLVDPDLGGELMALHRHFAATPTMIGTAGAPNPGVGASLRLARAVTAQIAEALSGSIEACQPDSVGDGWRVIEALRLEWV